jgi:hypothetical protein
MPCHSLAPIDPSQWLDVPNATRPEHAIAFEDDRAVTAIEAERHATEQGAERYELEIGWNDRSDRTAQGARG